MRVILQDGSTMDITDITEPVAGHDYQCDWKGDTIKAGRKYVRVVFKVKGEGFKSNHYCPQCWAEMNHD